MLALEGHTHESMVSPKRTYSFCLSFGSAANEGGGGWALRDELMKNQDRETE